jgi:hypothetical protein
MSLPTGCELTETHLVFWEMATESQLEETQRLYEFCCGIACTNALRPLGMVEVVKRPIPDIAAGEALRWGPRTLEGEAAREYSARGYVLCQLRLPVQPMGAPVPPGVSATRPPGR